ncbi:MAG: ABC transporter permease subunit, partial [Sneathiella sp.]|nr:ABC transporter permease subunit [Sneathiella sp.]
MTDSTLPNGEIVTIKRKLSKDDWVMRAFIVGIGIWLVITLLLPLYSMLSKSLENKDGSFIGLANYFEYFSTPALFYSINNSFFIALTSTVITISLASVFAFVLSRSTIPGRGIFKGIALLPLLAPSILPGIAFVYLFGRQGVLKVVLGDHSIYGPIGIIMGEVFYTFPHALMILIAAFSLADARLYEAAVALRTGRIRTFFTVTLPGIKYGLISAIFVVFTLVITDFGIP